MYASKMKYFTLLDPVKYGIQLKHTVRENARAIKKSFSKREIVESKCRAVA